MQKAQSTQSRHADKGSRHVHRGYASCAMIGSYTAKLFLIHPDFKGLGGKVLCSITLFAVSERSIGTSSILYKTTVMCKQLAFSTGLKRILNK